MNRQALAAVLAGLNSEQQVAATTENGPTLLLAGPGTGKTTTLTGRYAHLLNRGHKPSGILVSTFSKRAADELTARLTRACKVNLEFAPVGTLHGLCARLLKRYWRHAGLPSENFQILGEFETQRLLRQLSKDRLIDLQQAAGQISSWKDRMLSHEEAMTEAGGSHAMQAVARLYGLYDQELARSGAMDFGDLLVRVVGMLEQNDKLRSHISDRISQVVVDEYQDVNLVQDRLLRCFLDGRDERLWCVGDPDQAIFEWRSADPSYIVNFETRFPGSQVLRLTVNYRSTQEIVEAANAVISRNKARLPMKLVSSCKDPAKGAVVVAGQASGFQEASFIAESIEAMHSSGLPFEEIAVLYRSSWISPLLQYALAQKGIPFHLKGTPRLLGLPEARVFAALLSVAWRPEDPVGQEILKNEALGRRVQTRLPLVCQARSFAQSAKAAARAVINALSRNMGEDRLVLGRNTIEQLSEMACDAGDIDTFIERVNASSEADGPAVVLSTIHAAKGLEWDAVFLSGLEDGILPHRRALNEGGSLEEERRLFYVAITRARTWFCATWAQRRFGKAMDTSPFFYELSAGFGGLRQAGVEPSAPGSQQRAPSSKARRISRSARPF